MKKHTILMTRCLTLMFGLQVALTSVIAVEPDPPDIVMPDSPDEIKIRYAEANVELAKVELQKMVAANKQVFNLFAKDVLERKKADIRVAQELLRVARKSRENGDAVDVHLIRALEDARLTKRKYLRALEMKDRDAVYTDLDLKELRLKAELNQLRLAVWQDPQQTISLMQHMHWQIERLSEEVLNLQKKISDMERKP